MMIANITYAYTIELGPNEYEADEQSYQFLNGFHVSESKIEYIVKPVITGIEEYLKSFLEKPDGIVQREIDRNCTNEYYELVKNYHGYWS